MSGGDHRNRNGRPRRRRARRACLGALALLAAVTAHASGEDAGPDAVVAAIAEEVAAASPAGAAARTRVGVRTLAGIAAEHIDFEHMAEVASGRAWAAASPVERRAFTETFRAMLLSTFAPHVARYARDEQSMHAPRAEAAGTVAVPATVRPAVGPALRLTYRLRRNDGHWKLFDATVDGVSILDTLRASYAPRAGEVGLEGLTRILDERRAQLERS